MKNSTRILWTLALVLLIAGVICAGGAFVLAGFNPENLSTENAERFNLSYPASDKITSITVNDSNTAVRVVTGSQSEILVSYVETKHHKYTITMTNVSGGNGLVISGKNQRDGLSWLDFIGVMEVADKTLLITIPESYDLLSSVSVTTSNGNITILHIKSDSEIYVKTSNAKITASDLNTSDISFTTSNGDMNLTDITCINEMIAKTTNSNIICDNVTAESISLTTSNGWEKLYNVTAANDIILETRNGNIKANDTKSGKSFSATTTNSSITVDNIDSPDITLKTSNGNITGSVTGERSDYIISSKTSNGNNNLGDTTGDASSSASRRLTVKTSNSNISISFIG